MTVAATLRESRANYRIRTFAEQAAEVGDAICALGLVCCTWHMTPPSATDVDTVAAGLEHVVRQLRVLRDSPRTPQ